MVNARRLALNAVKATRRQVNATLASAISMATAATFPRPQTNGAVGVIRWVTAISGRDRHQSSSSRVMTNFLANTIEKMLFHPATVSDVEPVSESFHLISMQGEGLLGVASMPGQTIQFLVGPLTKRAYTPMDVDTRAGSCRFLFYRHGQGAGSEWAASLQKGQVCKLMRPKNSLDFTKDQGPALFFGDETSFAAAQALQQCQQGKASSHLFFEVISYANAQAVVSRLGLGRVTLIQKTSDGSHLEQVAHELSRLASTLDAPTWFFTGCALSIQFVRNRLKASGVSLHRGAVKPYWSPGKKGMD